MKTRISIIGSTNVDVIMRMPRLPQKGESVSDGEYITSYGGKGANQAIAAARIGGNAAFLTSLGDDQHGQTLLKTFSGEGLDVSHAKLRQGVPCGTAMIMVEDSGNNYLAITPGANGKITVDEINQAENLIRDSAIVMMQNEIPAPAIIRVLELARKHQTTVMLNYAPASNRAVPVTDAIGILAVNEIEAELLCEVKVDSKDSAAKAAKALRAMGPATVVVTLGDQGSYISSAGVESHFPIFPVKAVDATAAGDTYCGALAVALVEGKPLPEAAMFAAAAAALCVSRMGAQPSIPRRAEVDAFLKSAKA